MRHFLDPDYDKAPQEARDAFNIATLGMYGLCRKLAKGIENTLDLVELYRDLWKFKHPPHKNN